MHARGVSCWILLCLPALCQHGSTNAVNPYTSPEHAEAGGRLFRAQCGGCHGPTGSGTGAGPNLVSGNLNRGSSDEALFTTISKGVPGTTMPAFSAFSGLQVWQLVTFLRSLEISHEGSIKADPQAGAAVFRKSCLGCHAVGGEGGFKGPDLMLTAQRRSPAEIRKAIASPDADVPAEYWSVQISTTGGQKISGVRLNEDTHSIQLRDDKGRLRSVLKREIGDMELIRKSPMPNFSGKLTTAEIENVVAYIAGLRRQK